MTTILNKQCLRISSFVQAGLMFILSLSFLVLSFHSSENEVLRLIGESSDHLTNNHYEKKIQYTFIGIAFTCIIVGSLGMSAAYSQEHLITYIFGYMSLIICLLFGSIGTSFLLFSHKITSDFAKECSSNTGIAHSIDQIYR